MKKVIVIITMVIFIGACQNSEPPENESLDDEQATEQSETESADESNASNDDSADEATNESLNDDEYMKEKMANLTFYEFEFEIEYAEDKSYEAEIERDDNEPYEAEIEDGLNGIYLQGSDAFDEIYEKVQQLIVSSDTDHQDIIQQVLSVFGLPTDYEVFELEIKFHDGSELEFEHEQSYDN